MRHFAWLMVAPALLLAACDGVSERTATARTPTPLTTVATGSTCRSHSPVTQGSITYEVQGTVDGSGELWGLLIGGKPPFLPGRGYKIVWRMTGNGPLAMRAIGPGGELVLPTDGPTPHGGSNWNTHPGDEWGSIFNFPVAGCWDIHASRTDLQGDVLLAVEH